MNADYVDDAVCAEIPDRNEEPDLYQAVTSQMLHGPCGPSMTATCMKTVNGERRCRFGFPFEPCDSTIIPDSGRRPLYRRRCLRTHTKKGIPLNDRWVAPYNPHFLLKYHAHINVEACTGSSPVKYLVKYLHKGADLAMFRAVDENDEISQYENAVYIGPIDSCWRLWSFPTHGQSPAVYRLNYHEPDHQPIAWPRGISDAEFRRRLNDTSSELMAWFDYNRNNPSGHNKQLLYSGFPEHFTFQKKEKRWSPRRNMKTIGRMYLSYPGQGERYYIRLLLCHQRGCTSWEDLRTVNGVVYGTWIEAAEELGLLTDGNNWVEMFMEVAPLRLGWVLR